MFEENTIEVNEKAEKIINKLDQFNLLVNRYYGKIVNMTVNHIWSGGLADRYVRSVIQDKNEVLNYSNGIRRIALNIKKIAEETEKVVNANEGNI